MSSRKQINELEELAGRAEKLVTKLMAAGRHAEGHKMIEIHQALRKAADGHRANLKKRK